MYKKIIQQFIKWLRFNFATCTPVIADDCTYMLANELYVQTEGNEGLKEKTLFEQNDNISVIYT